MRWIEIMARLFLVGGAEMTKQELIQAAKEIREICKTNGGCAWTGGKCQFCYFDEEGAPMCAFICDEYWSNPADWDIERLEREK